MNARGRDYYVQAVKREVGWAYRQLNWVTPEVATRAMEERGRLLSTLVVRVNSSYLQNKLHQGKLSPGCVCCGEGTWSCMFLNNRCTASCFFCPQEQGMKEERPPAAERIVFVSPQDYADYVQRLNFKGVSFSGGEPLLEYRTLVSFITELRNKLGNNVYLWMYTNGDLVDSTKLEGLKQAGLDEMRFNIAARSYNLRPVELALQFIDRVSVEIPAIPEDFEAVKDSLVMMADMGIKHLNLHQLLATSYNYRAMADRGYTFLHHPSLTILESEMTALKLLLFAVENGIQLPINYCSQAYKVRLQGRGHRMRAAPLVLNGFEDITDSGYIRRITAQSTADILEHVVSNLKSAGCEDSRWSLNKEAQSLTIHPSLLPYISVEDCRFTLSYFEPYLRDAASASQARQSENSDHLVTKSYYRVNLSHNSGFEENTIELLLDTGRVLYAARILACEYKDLGTVAIRSFEKLFIDKKDRREVLKWFTEKYDITTKETVQDLAREKNILTDLEEWEQVPSGLPDIY